MCSVIATYATSPLIRCSSRTGRLRARSADASLLRGRGARCVAQPALIGRGRRCRHGVEARSGYEWVLEPVHKFHHARADHGCCSWSAVDAFSADHHRHPRPNPARQPPSWYGFRWLSWPNATTPVPAFVAAPHRGLHPRLGRLAVAAQCRGVRIRRTPRSLLLRVLGEQLSQNVLQDSSVAVVRSLGRRIDPHNGVEFRDR